jgi:mannosyltransferase
LPAEEFDLLISHLDAVLAPYYLWMRWWIRVFGDSEAALRAPAALAMGICAGLVALLGTRLVGPRVGLRAGLIFAVLPVVSRYGQEARPYAFATMFATLASLLLLRLLEQPRSLARAAAYAAALTALGLSHVVALLILPAHAACCVQVSRRSPHLRIAWRPLTSFALAACAAVGAIFSLILRGAQQRADQIGRHGDADELFALGHKLIRGSTTGALVIGLALATLALRTSLSSRQPIILRLWAIVPPVFLLSTYSVLHLWALRYIVFTLPALALLAANALELPQRSPHFRALATTIAVVALLALGGTMHVKARNPGQRTSGDYRAAARALMRSALPGDALAFGGNQVTPRIHRLALAYELRHRPALSDIFVSRSMRELGVFAVEECKEPRACLASSVQRVWLMTSAPATDLFQGMPRERARLLQQEFVVAEVYPHWHATLALLRRDPQQSQTE